MTIDSSVRRAGPFAGNGSTVDFPFEFKVFGREDIRVTVADPDNVEIVLQLDSDYSVIVNPDQAQAPGGTVTYPISGSPLPVGHKLVLTGALSYEQPTAITNLGGFYPKVLEDALDRATIQIQQLEEEVNRSIKIGVADGIPADEYRDSLLEAAADAVAAASAAQTSESNAHDSEEAAALSAGAALVSEGKAHDSEEAAALSESNAHDSEEAAALSAGAALVSEGKAHDSEEAAALSESNAHDSEEAAALSAGAALVSEGKAHDSEVAAGASEAKSKAYLESLTQPFAFYKPDYNTPCMVKTGAQTLSIKAGTVVVADAVAHAFGVDTPITMPTLVAGSDYSVWVNADGTAQAVLDMYGAPATAPTPGAKKIGGFHYGLVAPGTTVASGSFATSGVTSAGGSMGWLQADVDKLAGINQFSIWDLAFRCKGEQRGMTYDPYKQMWAGIYFVSDSPHIYGPSAYNTNIASGSVLPFVSPAYGGDGILKYATLNAFSGHEILAGHGLRYPTYDEFMSFAFGVTEGQSLGGAASTVPATLRQPGYTSRIGIEQATGHQIIIGGPVVSSHGTVYAANGRGSWFGSTSLVMLGGGRSDAANSGSRFAGFSNPLALSSWGISVRAAGDHLKLGAQS